MEYVFFLLILIASIVLNLFGIYYILSSFIGITISIKAYKLKYLKNKELINDYRKSVLAWIVIIVMVLLVVLFHFGGKYIPVYIAGLAVALMIVVFIRRKINFKLEAIQKIVSRFSPEAMDEFIKSPQELIDRMLK